MVQSASEKSILPEPLKERESERERRESERERAIAVRESLREKKRVREKESEREVRLGKHFCKALTSLMSSHASPTYTLTRTQTTTHAHSAFRFQPSEITRRIHVTYLIYRFNYRMGYKKFLSEGKPKVTFFCAETLTHHKTSSITTTHHTIK